LSDSESELGDSENEQLCDAPSVSPSALGRVLIVDDARTVRLYYRGILEGAGIDVAEATNGLEGLERAGEVLPDLLVVDINMPKMDGYTMLRAIRADARTRSIPAIMISTEAEGRDAQRAYDAGANVYLVKPVRPARLLEFAHLLLGIPA
jgi:two-component system chemotaxis response regulator CheY